jgi:hypothetical protein
MAASSAQLVSCNKFLDIAPRTEVREDQQFNSEQGFKDALAGVYINMKDLSTYGTELSFGTIEHLVSSWDVTSNSLEQQIGLFNFSDSRVIKTFDNIFSKQYKTIANINSILQNIDANKSVFKTKGTYELIKGECLGLRALIHLDLMRLYGPMPKEPSIGNNLSYVTEFGKEIKTHISYEAYREMLFQDINNSADLLKTVDPLLEYSMADLRNPNGSSSKFRNDDTFIAFRNMRMNYYAIKALEARAALWYGENEKAYNAAKEVVEAKNTDNTQKFKISTGPEFSQENFTLTTEQIFGLYNQQMSTAYTDFFSTGIYRKGTSSTTINTKLFGNTGTDFRESSLWNLLVDQGGSKSYVIKKYQILAETPTALTDFKQIPMIRTSELYLILAETAPLDEGLEYFKQFRDSRNISTLSVLQNKESLLAEIVKEYRKEFYAEGQAFYTYKRLNISKEQFLFLPASATLTYLLPMPTVESVN